MLDSNMKTQLKSYLERLTRPVEIVASVDQSDSSREMLELLADITDVSSQVSVDVVHDDAELKPSFVVNRACASRVSRWVTSSRRSCSRCCRREAIRRRSMRP